MLPIAEILFGRLKADDPKIYGYDAKWTPDSAAYIGTLRRFGLEQNEPELAKTFKQFGLASDLVRVQRLCASDPTGTPFIIEINPNPYLTLDTEDAAAAAEAGLSYHDFIASIVEGSLKFSQANA